MTRKWRWRAAATWRSESKRVCATPSGPAPQFASATPFLIESAPADRRGFYGSWQMVGQGVGVLLGALVSAAVTRGGHDRRRVISGLNSGAHDPELTLGSSRTPPPPPSEGKGPPAWGVLSCLHSASWRQGGADAHVSSTTRIHRCARRRSGGVPGGVGAGALTDGAPGRGPVSVCFEKADEKCSA